MYSLHQQRKQLRSGLNSLGRFQVLKKYKIWMSSMNWKRASTMHKLDVWSRSDWAALGIDIPDQTLVGQTDEEAHQTEPSIIVFVEDATPSDATMVARASSVLSSQGPLRPTLASAIRGWDTPE
ncbi:hypothetical protein OH77DRAFT_1194777 [Trametes cingulata]|nr:hypothetical protein OH77DRAFT_1194777 [Trametes cingulata]